MVMPYYIKHSLIKLPLMALCDTAPMNSAKQKNPYVSVNCGNKWKHRSAIKLYNGSGASLFKTISFYYIMDFMKARLMAS
jgi:hypothetical protein